MNESDIFSRDLIEEAKCFLEKANKEPSPQGKNAYLHASLFIAFAALEAHVNSIVDDFVDRKELTVLEKSILSEKNIIFDSGEFKLTNQLKMYRLEERIEFIIRRFTGKPIKEKTEWWDKLRNGISMRNKLTHPRNKELITAREVEDSILAILDTLTALYRAVYKAAYPLKRKGLISSMNF